MRARRRRRARSRAVGSRSRWRCSLPGAGDARPTGRQRHGVGGAVQATLPGRRPSSATRTRTWSSPAPARRLFDGSPSPRGSPARGRLHLRRPGKRDAPLQVVDLDADGEPEVLVDAYTGGAHCCALTEILRFDGAAYAPAETTWGNFGYALKDLDGDGPPSSSPPTTRSPTPSPRSRAPSTRRWCSTTTPTAKGPSRRHAAFPALARKNVKDALHIAGPRAAQHARRSGRRGLRRRPLPAGPRARGAPVPGAGAQARRPAQRDRARAAQLRAQAAGLPAQAGLPLGRAGASIRSASSPSATTSPWRSWRPRRVSTSALTVTAPCSTSARASPPDSARPESFSAWPSRMLSPRMGRSRTRAAWHVQRVALWSHLAAPGAGSRCRAPR